jgi:hypothetical protein
MAFCNGIDPYRASVRAALFNLPISSRAIRAVPARFDETASRQSPIATHTWCMKETRAIVQPEKCDETPVREPLFRRYQIKIKAGVRAGAVPTGQWPIGF